MANNKNEAEQQPPSCSGPKKNLFFATVDLVARKTGRAPILTGGRVISLTEESHVRQQNNVISRSAFILSDFAIYL